MDKVKKLILNGAEMKVDDSSALKLPEDIEPQDGDILVYSEEEEAFIYQQKSDIVEIDSQLDNSSDNPVKNRVLFTQFASKEKKKDIIEISFEYDSSTRKIKASYLINNESISGIRAKNTVYINYSSNTLYNNVSDDSSQQSTFSGQFYVNPAGETTELIALGQGIFPIQRLVLFNIVNPIDADQIVILKTPSIYLPADTEETPITGTVSLGNVSTSNMCYISFNEELDGDVVINYIISEPGYSDVSGSTTIEAGESYVSINLGKSAQRRQIRFSIGESESQHPILLSKYQDYFEGLLTAIDVLPLAVEGNINVIRFRTYNIAIPEDGFTLQIPFGSGNHGAYPSTIIIPPIEANSYGDVHINRPDRSSFGPIQCTFTYQSDCKTDQYQLVLTSRSIWV